MALLWSPAPTAGWQSSTCRLSGGWSLRASSAGLEITESNKCEYSTHQKLPLANTDSDANPRLLHSRGCDCDFILTCRNDKYISKYFTRLDKLYISCNPDTLRTHCTFNYAVILYVQSNIHPRLGKQGAAVLNCYFQKNLMTHNVIKIH